jgi:hypothetical protein
MAENNSNLAETLTTEELFQLVESKLHLLTEMRDLTLTQTDLVAHHDMSALMTLLSRKQGLMDSLHEVQSKLQPFQAQDPESRIWSTPDRRKSCQAMVAQCDAIVQNLIVMENRSLDNMIVQREMVAAQLQQNINASTLQHAYHSSDISETTEEGFLSIEG